MRDLLHAIALWTVIGIAGVSLAVYPRFFSAQLTHALAVLDISNGFVAIWLGIGLVLMLVYTFEKMLQLRPSSAAAGLRGGGGDHRADPGVPLGFRCRYHERSIRSFRSLPRW